MISDRVPGLIALWSGVTSGLAGHLQTGKPAHPPARGNMTQLTPLVDSLLRLLESRFAGGNLGVLVSCV